MTAHGGRASLDSVRQGRLCIHSSKGSSMAAKRAGSILVGVAALAGAGLAHAGGSASLKGVVENDHHPVAGAQVALSELNRSVVTDKDGTYTLDGVDPGNYNLVVSAEGQAPVQRQVMLHAGQTIEQDVEMGGAA